MDKPRIRSAADLLQESEATSPLCAQLRRNLELAIAAARKQREASALIETQQQIAGLREENRRLSKEGRRAAELCGKTAAQLVRLGDALLEQKGEGEQFQAEGKLALELCRRSEAVMILLREELLALKSENERLCLELQAQTAPALGRPQALS